MSGFWWIVVGIVIGISLPVGWFVWMWWKAYANNTR